MGRLKKRWHQSQPLEILTFVNVTCTVITVVVTLLSYRIGQEDLKVSISHDIQEPMHSATHFTFSPTFEKSVGFQTHWVVTLSNVSNSAMLSITDLKLMTFRFWGFAVAGDESHPQHPNATAFHLAGKDDPLVLPLRIEAGSTVKLDIFPVISLAKETPFAPSEQSLKTLTGEFIIISDQNDTDMFGNKGEAEPDGSLNARDPESVRQPWIRVTASTSRGYSYVGMGYWYSHIYK